LAQEQSLPPIGFAYCCLSDPGIGAEPLAASLACGSRHSVLAFSRGSSILPRWAFGREPAKRRGGRMVEAGPESIPTNLRDAFHFAVLCTPRHWSGGDPDPEVISLDRKPFTPSAICGLVTRFTDPMPRFIYDVLRELGYPEGDLSYAAGARFVIALIENRKRLQQWVRQQQ
jgi:hypothetical protein